MSAHLKKLISEVLIKLNVPSVDFAVFFTTNFANGDYATNAALILGKEIGRKPAEFAAKIVDEIVKNQPEYLEKIEIAGAGFINFFLSPKFFAAALGHILALGDDYGKSQQLTGQKVMVEYTDPNPFKEFHIGHLMSNTIGETISRLIEWQGAEVKRVCYQGDVGLHVAKALWGFKVAGEREWGKAYVAGSRAHEEDSAAKREIELINKKIYERSDSEINALYDRGKKQSLEDFEKIYRRLGTKFDFYFFESESGLSGKKIIEDKLGTVFEKSDGAIIFRGEKYGLPAGRAGLHTRVFINSAGLPTYEAKELGLAKLKDDKYPYDLSVIVTGNEVNAYFTVLLKTLELIFPDLAKKTEHIGHGMLMLPTGKMSSRTGNVVTAEELLLEVQKLTLRKLAGRDLLVESEKERIAEQVAVAAIKYSILKQSPGRDIIFDFNKSVSFEGDSGPYLQYSYVRAQSVLEKAGYDARAVPDLPEAPSELLRLIPRFAETATRAASEYAPQYLVTYLIDLAGAFNSFYAKNQIIGSRFADYRLALTAAVAQILKSGLWLLGIATPARM